MASPCYLCKGRGYCGRSSCALSMKTESLMKNRDIASSQDFQGTSPSVFVGHHGYPTLNVGILAAPGEDGEGWKRDAPRYWSSRKLAIPDIIDYRSSLINSRFKSGIKPSGRLLEMSQEIGMSSKAVDVEVSLQEKPSFRLNTDPYSAPTGPLAGLKDAKITSNPKIDRLVDKAVSDTDLHSAPALTMLYGKGFDENFLTRILSVGTLGAKANRRLVPTRWSITAVDDTIGKNLRERISGCTEEGPSAFFGGYLGNFFLVLLFPHPWSYELFEVYLPGTDWNKGETPGFTTDYEPNSGRKDYASNCAGGYYAARLPILDHLAKAKRQSGVLVIRMITGDYSVPLGVWVVREGARDAMSKQPICFGDDTLMISYAKSLMKKKFGFDIDPLLKNSRLLSYMKDQRRLSSYL